MKINKLQTILIVDDESINFNILSNVLKDRYRILVAKSGKQALKIIANDEVDLVLLDIVMPGLDGYEVLRRLKNTNFGNRIPVIFTTSKTEDQDEAKGLQLGAVDYIRKPFFLPIVEARVQTHLELKLKNDILTELVSLDGLTNIFNRRKFDEVLCKEWKRALRIKRPLTLLIIDVDYFKLFNDNYGHAAGDVCLKRLCGVFKACLNRPEDFLARYGGEEFCILLPNTDHEGGRCIAASVIAHVENEKIKHAFSPVAKHITVSVGGATGVPGSQCATFKELLDKADQMLYAAKDGGRNVLRMFDFKEK